MGQGVAALNGGIVSFPVVLSNPSGTIARWTITDSAHLLLDSKMIRAVLESAIDAFLVANRAQINTNGDSAIKGSNDYDPRHVGDGFIAVSWNFSSKYAQITFTALTSLTISGTVTITPPFGDTA